MQEIEKKFRIDLNPYTNRGGETITPAILTKHLTTKNGVRVEMTHITQLYLPIHTSASDKLEQRLRAEVPDRSGAEATYTQCVKRTVREGGILNRFESEKKIDEEMFNCMAKDAEKRLCKDRLRVDKSITFDFILDDEDEWLCLCEIEFNSESVADMFTAADLQRWLNKGIDEYIKFNVTDVTQDPAYRSWSLAKYI